jgi:benzoate 4-monooxygenase
MTSFLTGSLPALLSSPYVWAALLSPLATVFVYVVLPHFVSRAGLRKYRGPSLAGFTRLWLAKQVREGSRSVRVHEQHEKYGALWSFSSSFSPHYLPEESC